jgi:hypothetical protein
MEKYAIRQIEKEDGKKSEIARPSPTKKKADGKVEEGTAPTKKIRGKRHRQEGAHEGKIGSIPKPSAHGLSAEPISV